MKADDKLIFYENAENDGLLSERTVIYVPIKNNKRWKCLTFLFAALTVLMLTWTFCGHSIIGWWHHARIKNDVSFSFANYYGDHMVLQKSPSQANVWGWAKVSDIGSEVTITLSSTSNPSNAKEYKATVTAGPLADRAVWQTLLDPIDGSSESFTIVATLGQQKAQLNDVLFGDVWICSGQSNMQLSVGSMYNASQELDKVANFPNIRLIYVAMIPSNKPEYELLGLNQPWALPTKDTVQGFSAVCWLYGREVHQTVKYPIGLVLSCWGGTRAEAWSSPDALKKCPGSKTEPAVSGKADDADAEYSAAWWKNQTHVDPSSVKTDLSTVAPDPNVNSVLWNGMMHPLSNMTITGAIWYQGEANVGYRTDEYNCTFRAMIEDWRANFNQFSHYQTSNQFAFGFMQLGPNHKETMNATQGFSDIRWHQTSDIGFTPNSRLQNVFMATAMDTEDFIHDIHPRDKITPAHRLALAGLNVAYKRSSIHSRGPTPTAVQIDTDKNTLVVEYDWGQGDDNKIDVRAKFGFDVCCSADGKTGCAMSGTANWYSANIVDFSDYTVTLSWKQCAGSFLMGVRYAWRETPCYYLSCPIYGQTTKLPATPFIYQGLITGQRTLL